MKKLFTFYIEEKLLNQLRAQQQKTGVTVAEQIRRAIEAQLQTKGKPREKRNGKAS